MPWLETSSVEQRDRFVADERRGLHTRSELCARYSISRKTGYKWLDRFAEDGRRGLRDRSHAPHHCPHRIASEIAELLSAARRRHPDWGPASCSTGSCRGIPRSPTRRGAGRAREEAAPPSADHHPGVVAPTTHAPNDLWTTDFKGQFRTRDGIWCYPLTLADQHTRFLLECQGLRSTQGHGVRTVLERAFRCFGLPRAIRTDNGVPFATNGIHGLSQLNVWWLRLGIQHQRIRPASPQENGAHERMHKTLKAGACRLAAA